MILQNKIANKFKIMHLRTSHGIHGAERVMLGLLKSADHGNFQVAVTLVGSEPDLNRDFLYELKKSGFDVNNFVIKGRLDIRAVHELRRYLILQNVDLIHCHDFKSNFYGLLATIGTGIKRVSTVHGSTKDSLKLKLYLGFNEWVLLRFFHKIIAVSEHLFDELKYKGIGDKVVVINNGLDSDFFNNSNNHNESEPSLPYLSGKKVIGIVGRLFPDKGHEILFRAVKDLIGDFPELVLLVIGDGPLREYLEKKGTVMEIRSHIFFLGTRKNMQEVYNILDVFVMPSFREGLPMALLEAMLAGKPVIGTKVGAIPKLLGNGIGLLIEPGDSAGLANAIRYVLLNIEQYKRYAQEAISVVKSGYSSEVMTSKTERLYRDLLSDKYTKKCEPCMKG